MEHKSLDSLSEMTDRASAHREWADANPPTGETSLASYAESAFDAGVEHGRLTTDPERISRRICKSCMLKVAGVIVACEEILACAESKKRGEAD